MAAIEILIERNHGVEWIQAVHFKDHAIIFATSHGLKVIVEEAKSMQGNAFLQASLFQPYELNEEQVPCRSYYLHLSRGPPFMTWTLSSFLYKTHIEN